MTVHGRLVADPERPHARAGVPMTTFRVASTVRR